jgi:hypothetical protein
VGYVAYSVARAYIGCFDFKGGDQQKLVGNLSGGERGCLHLAKTLIAGDHNGIGCGYEFIRSLPDGAKYVF